MLFSSQLFILVFLPFSLLLWYGLAHMTKARLGALTFASFIFYGWWDVRVLPLLLATITLNWWVGRSMRRLHCRRALLIIGVAINLITLGFFKYTNFFAAFLHSMVGQAHEPWEIILPLAISFFTFQQISYLVDASKGKAPDYSWLEFAAYVAFFPQLIAGPIVRHDELVGQFSKPVPRAGLSEMAGRGLLLFALGLFKKVALADELADFSDPVFANAVSGGAPPLGEAWIGALAYSLQLYFDFSGYSDMAIGLSAMFGFVLPINFNAPYRAVNIRDFWRRWHMTLSRFFRDYLYIPLGGNRGSVGRISLVVMTTMLLCGLWHGAGWTFVAWGGLHGLGICANHLWNRTGLRLPIPLAWLGTMIFVVFGWVIFRAESFTAATNIMQGMTAFGHIRAGNMDGLPLIILAALLAVAGPVSHVWAIEKARPSPVLAVGVGFILMAITLRVGEGRSLDFIYFQF